MTGPDKQLAALRAEIDAKTGEIRLQRLLPHTEIQHDQSHVIFVLTEFQIADKATAQQNESGSSSHEAYKARQKQAVMRRLGMVFDHEAEIEDMGMVFQAVVYAITAAQWRSGAEARRRVAR